MIYLYLRLGAMIAIPTFMLFAWKDRHILARMSSYLLLICSLLNVTAVAANGCMPVYKPERLPSLTLEGVHCAVTPNTKFLPLIDRYNLRFGIASPGDFFALAAIILMCVAPSGKRKHYASTTFRPLHRTPSN